MREPAASSETCWRCVGQTIPVVRKWPEDWPVYNPLSGHTHLLDSFAGDMLLAVMERPQSSAHLRERVAALLEMANDDDLAARVDRILEHLDEIGLIEPAQPC